MIKAAHFSLFVDQKTEINLQSKTPRFLNLVGFLQEMVPYVHSATSNNNGQKFSNEIIQLLDDIFVDLGKGVPNELETQKLKTSLLYEVYSSLNDFSKKQALGKLMLAESQGTYDLCVRDLKSFSFTAESEQEKNTKLMQILRKMGYLIRLAEKVAMANGVISSSDLLKFQANCHREVSTYALDKQLPIPLKFRLNILDLLEKDFLRNIEKDVLDLVKNQIGECIVDSSDSKRSSLNKLKKHIAKAEDLSDVMSAIKDFQGEKADKYPNTNLQLETIQPHLEKLCVKIAVLSVPSFT
ncbi:MAG: hypothetical protein HWD59_08535 [Coxiellaceae bacterium]|nr:MAG: hypothetical protein HWD59_08535 [Coxiellaceae bacterium]